MCCRYYVEATPYFIELGELAQENTMRNKAHHNEGNVLTVGEISPGNQVPVIASSKAGKKIAFLMFWGFRSRTGSLIINARSETAAEKPTFAPCLRSRRIVLPAEAFFEWRRETGEKYRFTVPGLSTFYLGGLYRREGEETRFVILTRAANGDMAPVHHRMPLILGPEAVRAYLTREDSARGLLTGEAPRLYAEACRSS